MNKTPIEWKDFTVNPFRFRNRETGKVGHHCTKISPGCKNCYSSKMQSGPYLSGLTFSEENKPKGEFFLDEAVLQQVLRRKKPARIFWADMTDMFLEDYPDEWIDRCFAVMDMTPHLTHQVLTKRGKRMVNYMCTHDCTLRSAEIAAAAKCLATSVTLYRLPAENVFDGRSVALGGAWKIQAWPLPNVHLGVSVEDQQRKNRIDELRETPAAVRFLSLEPLLEGLGTLDLRGIDWVIVGGESGPGARPMHPDWVRSIRDQCLAAGVAFFFKQWGEWLPIATPRMKASIGSTVLLHRNSTAKVATWSDVMESRGDVWALQRVGKKAAGRLLDGREWNELPTPRSAHAR